MDGVTQKVLHTIREHALFSPGDTVFVALSGGADSVALLHIMVSLQQKLSLSSVRALHLHHGLRGETADRDAAFVTALCRNLGVPLTVSYADTALEAKYHHESVEEAGRRLRYAFFERECSGFENAKIATAHNADDQVETVLLHIIRGCGLHGLCGIPEQRGTIVRPLIACAADDIRAFCQSHQFKYMTDETNASLCYSRNRVRHQVLPAMRMINARTDRSLLRLASIAKEENGYLHDTACAALEKARIDDNSYCVQTLLSLHTVILKRTLALAIRQHGVASVEYRHILELASVVASGGTVNLPGEVLAVCENDKLRFQSKPPHREHAEQVPLSVPLPLNTSVVFNDMVYCAEILSQSDYQQMLKVNKNLLHYCVSYDIISRDLKLRTRKPGDVFRPYKRGCRKTLKKYFNERKTSPADRESAVLLCDENGILALLGMDIDERAVVHEHTEQILHIKINNLQGL